MHPDDLFQLYEASALDREGYPPEWDAIGDGVGLKHMVRARAGDRCQRCGHPYQPGMGEWSPCDEHCTHGVPIRWREGDGEWSEEGSESWVDDAARVLFEDGCEVQARWRILTVHHLNEVKLDCRWWNLVALCQRCHLNVQRRVKMDRPWPWEHSEWFKPYVAGYYAWRFKGWYLSREHVDRRMDELLALGARESAVERMPL